MPLFDWSAGSIGSVATPHAWIYLAVAIPLTFGTVAVYFAWLRLSGTTRSRGDQTEVAGLSKEIIADEEQAL